MRTCICCLLAAVVSCSTPVFAQDALQVLYIRDTTGPSVPDTIVAGQPVTFRIRAINFALYDGIVGFRNAFQIFSPTGATWSGVSGSFAPAINEDRFCIRDIEQSSADGSGVDTVAFIGYACGFDGICGLPPDFAGEVFEITIGPIDRSFHGHTICIDSVSALTSGSSPGPWWWRTGICDIFTGETAPEWMRSYCFTVVDTTTTAVPETIGEQAVAIVDLTVKPNPFNTGTVLTFELSTPGHVAVEVFNVQGRLVRRLFKGVFGIGQRSVLWDGRDDSGKEVASGVYFCRVVTGEGRRTKSMVLLR